MGQKTHPIGLRLGIVKQSSSRWFATKDMPALLKEDELIRKYLKTRLGHAAIAQIDKDQLFYLRSRGLGEPIAQRLVIEGFMQELVERFEEGPVREAMSAALERRLSRVLD